jgi:hypothetical protein
MARDNVAATPAPATETTAPSAQAGRIEMSAEQFSAAITTAATAAVAAALAQIQGTHAAPPPNRGPQHIEDFPGQYASVMREARNRKVTDDPEPVACRGEMGATFRAQINKAGIVVALLDYREPPESMKHEDDGGHVPNGSPIYEDEGAKRLAVHFKQWRYETYWQTDLRMFVGKKISTRAHLIVRTEPAPSAREVMDRVVPVDAAAAE